MAQKAATPTNTSTEHVPAGEHGGGFPPFQKDTFASQLVWLAITFVLLYLLISRIAVPRIGGIFEERSKRIQGDLAAAQRLKAESEAALASYEKALADARGNAQTIAGDAFLLNHFRHQRAVGIALTEGLELIEGGARLGLIALGLRHLIEVRHRQLVLRVVGALVRGEVRQELLVLALGAQLALGRAVAQVRVTETELGVGPQRTLRIAVHELAVQVPGERGLGDADRERLVAEAEMVVREHFWPLAGRTRR